MNTLGGGQIQYRKVSEIPDEEQLRLNAMLSSSDDAIIGEDLNGVITSWNHTAELIFGYTAEEAIGQPIHLIVPSDRIEQEDEVLARIRTGQSVDHYETIRQTKKPSSSRSVADACRFGSNA